MLQLRVVRTTRRFAPARWWAGSACCAPGEGARKRRRVRGRRRQMPVTTRPGPPAPHNRYPVSVASPGADRPPCVRSRYPPLGHVPAPLLPRGLQSTRAADRRTIGPASRGSRSPLGDGLAQQRARPGRSSLLREGPLAGWRASSTPMIDNTRGRNVALCAPERGHPRCMLEGASSDPAPASSLT